MKTQARLFQVFFFVSGMAGLIHETVWARYLGILLGHSAYGQVLTLSVYMGGIGIGSFLASRFLSRIRSPLRAYAYVELGIALGGFVFHDVFVAARSTLLDSGILLGRSSSGAALACYALGVLLTLPWAILLGATYPLATAGLMRINADGGKDSIARLYFANSFGAALGALANSFLFIPALGTAGSLATAGVCNGLVGISALIFTRSEIHAAPSPEPMREPTRKASPALLLWIAALTGLSSFLYEIGWTRFLALLLGSSTHAFDLMVSAFILGLALGALWVHFTPKRGQDLTTLLVAQACMAACAVASILGYQWLFEFGNFLNKVLQRNLDSYPIRLVIQYAIGALVMSPAAFFAGMTLPVITNHLCAKGDESYTGKVYGFNTIGAILGALLGGLVLMPLVGLSKLVTIGAIIDLVLAFVLLKFVGRSRAIYGILTVSLLLVGASAFMKPDDKVLTSGVFRGVRDFGMESTVTRIDGRSATISFTRTPTALSIATNGKPDASLSLQGSSTILADEATQDVIALYGRGYMQGEGDAALIGFGSGMTAQHLLVDKRIRKLDIIEIEPAVWELAKGFAPRNNRPYTDPRSSIHFEDARTFFSRTGTRYDLIVSEPSNPWVSGVASLFTAEYYTELKQSLSDRGVLIQWLHQYEFNDSLLLSILGAIGDNFPHVRILTLPTHADIVIAASNHPLPVVPPTQSIWMKEDLATMRRYRVTPDGIPQSFEVLTETGLTWLTNGIRRNSEFHPLVEDGAARAFFSGDKAHLLRSFLSGALSPLEGIEQQSRLHRAQRLPPGNRLDSLILHQLQDELLALDPADTVRFDHFLRTRIRPHCPPATWQPPSPYATIVAQIAASLDSMEHRSLAQNFFLFQWEAIGGNASKAEEHRFGVMQGRYDRLSPLDHRDLLIAALRIGATRTARMLHQKLKSSQEFSPLELQFLDLRIKIDSTQGRSTR